MAEKENLDDTYEIYPDESKLPLAYQEELKRAGEDLKIKFVLYFLAI